MSCPPKKYDNIHILQVVKLFKNLNLQSFFVSSSPTLSTVFCIACSRITDNVHGTVSLKLILCAYTCIVSLSYALYVVRNKCCVINNNTLFEPNSLFSVYILNLPE